MKASTITRLRRLLATACLTTVLAISTLLTSTVAWADDTQDGRNAEQAVRQAVGGVALAVASCVDVHPGAVVAPFTSRSSRRTPMSIPRARKSSMIAR